LRPATFAEDHSAPAAERTVDGLWDKTGALLPAFTPRECENFFAAASRRRLAFIPVEQELLELNLESSTYYLSIIKIILAYILYFPCAIIVIMLGIKDDYRRFRRPAPQIIFTTAVKQTDE
jgi:hypothetical protein